MKTTKKALSLNVQTIRVIDDSLLVGVNGGNEAQSRINSNYICLSNAGDNNQSCGNCTRAAGGE